MSKKSFAFLVLTVVGGLLFALGMCMCLLPEWDSFVPGVIFGAIGIVLGLITVFVWRKMENKAPIKVSGKTIGGILIGIVGTIAFGVGMCMVLVWDKMILGIVIGIVGIVILLCLIPFIKGLK